MALGKEGDVVWDHLTVWILALVALAVILFLYFALTDKASGAVQFLKNLLRFGK